jgi:peptidylprolyl isomerase
MTQAKTQDKVSVHYTGTLDDGTVFDSSVEREPLTFTLGEGQIIPGFEEAVVGMETGQKRTVRIPADQAYGPRRDDRLIDVPRDQFPPEIEPQVGQQLQVQQPNGQPAIVAVAQVSADTVTLDANHPLAGQALTFEIELVTIG